ncbi:MAG TPA: FtsQ-type POTRA domain-containing protein [Candidatus Corynebacterium gallistercoris]|uniref:FtsQ-type POTRA domain-containing protein n=1 Tax=Candidatus Corynebacterium gallistercoris TaxID=2838530 RepID=A0A9D1RZB9_9CORY|nr:FtsQ-type POTRA domain-containing protein [Candidatus Corynebacterium gallistercoris]
MKKTSWIILAVVAIAAVAVAAAYFFPILTVKSVEVVGAKHADVAAVEEAAGVDQGENMLRVDTATAAKGVSAVPWVEKVTVSRSWPTTITVDVTEHEPVGFVMDGDTPQVVDAHGRVFLAGVQPEGSVEFDKASADDSAALEAAATAVTALNPELRAQVEKVEVPTAESVVLFFPEGRSVTWGSAERAEEKAEATRIVLGREGQQWNVSNPAMPSVKN